MYVSPEVGPAVRREKLRPRKPYIPPKFVEEFEPIGSIPSQFMEGFEPIGSIPSQFMEEFEPIGSIPSQFMEEFEPIGSTPSPNLEGMQGLRGGSFSLRTDGPTSGDGPA